VLIGQEFGRCIPVPYAGTHAPSSNLALAIVADINEVVDQVSVHLGLHCVGHFDFPMTDARAVPCRTDRLLADGAGTCVQTAVTSRMKVSRS
jgi:hypothetical protein